MKKKQSLVNEQSQLKRELAQKGISIAKNSEAKVNQNQSPTAVTHQAINLVSTRLENLSDFQEESIASGTRADLYQAIVDKDFTLAKALLKASEPKRIDINWAPAEGRYKGKSLLWIAIDSHQWDIVIILLERALTEPDLNSGPEEGQDKGISVLWYAIFYHRWALVNELLAKTKQPPNINAYAKQGDYYGQSVIGLLIEFKKWDLIDEILTKIPFGSNLLILSPIPVDDLCELCNRTSNIHRIQMNASALQPHDIDKLANLLSTHPTLINIQLHDMEEMSRIFKGSLIMLQRITKNERIFMMPLLLLRVIKKLKITQQQML